MSKNISSCTKNRHDCETHERCEDMATSVSYVDVCTPECIEASLQQYLMTDARCVQEFDTKHVAEVDKIRMHDPKKGQDCLPEVQNPAHKELKTTRSHILEKKEPDACHNHRESGTPHSSRAQPAKKLAANPFLGFVHNANLGSPVRASRFAFKQLGEHDRCSCQVNRMS